MDTVFRVLPGFICVGGMALCMVMMGGMHRRSSGSDKTADSAAPDDVAALRDEVARLRSELDEREHRPVA